MHAYWGTQVWNIDINFVFFKKQIKKKSTNSNAPKSCGGSSRLLMHLRNHFLITNGYPFLVLVQ